MEGALLEVFGCKGRERGAAWAVVCGSKGCWGCAAGVVRLMVEESEEVVIRVVEIGLG